MQLDRQVYVRAERFLHWNAEKLVFNAQVTPQWIETGEGSDVPKGDRFWYRVMTRQGKRFMLVDPAQATREPAFDHVRLAAAISRTTGKACTHDNLPFDSFEFTEDRAAMRFDIGDEGWLCNLESYELTQGDKLKKPEDELRSPDGRWAAFVRKYNLYVRNIESGEEIQLTHDGRLDHDYATPADETKLVYHLSEKKYPPAAVWSPDSKRIFTHKLDQRRVKKSAIMQHVPKDGSARPIAHVYRYPQPGDKDVPMADYLVIDIATRRSTFFQMEQEFILFQYPKGYKYAAWSADSQQVYFLKETRGYQCVQLWAADASTGECRQILEERGKTQVQVAWNIYDLPKIPVLNKGSEIIWFSQRDGWAHLYLYDGRSGALKNRITSGAWVVREILRVDEDNRWVYFTASGRDPQEDPYIRSLYRARLDGCELELLTPEAAEHSISFSPTSGYFVDTYSRVDQPPVSVLRAADGTIVLMLEQADVEMLLATGWRWPEPFKVRATDGINDLYGVLYHPTNFDPDKKYPVIEAIYPGPQTIRTPKSFADQTVSSAWYWEPQSLAELGFIVVTIDGPGTPFRSKAWHDWGYGRQGRMGGLAEHVAGIQKLAATRPYMDVERMGITGHSGGGNATTRAMFDFPAFYKVGVASASNSDQRGFSAGWGERYQGMPDGDNYDEQNNTLVAQHLQGKLLMMVGEIDYGVHPSMTFHLIDALIKANKDFDFLILPNRDHGGFLDPYFVRRRWDYFVEHLLAMEPPQGYEVKPQQTS